MPYIKREIRECLAEDVKNLIEAIANETIIHNVEPAGVLNYVITKLIRDWYGSIRNHDLNYAAINTAIGALECAKLEYYRMVAAPYEDKKIQENGDVD